MNKRSLYSRIALLLCIAAAVVLSGCAVHRSFIPEVHKVRRGESLTVIAAHYGLNWHRLARWNNIKPPYTIYVGERLSLDPFPPLNYDRMRQRRQTAVAQRHPTPRSTVTELDQNRRFTVSSVGAAEPPAVTTRQTVNTSEQHTQPSVEEADTANEKDNAKPVSSTPLMNTAGWRWPLAASVLGGGEIGSARHGINIRGVVGTPVYAARAGQVVYSGAGLQGIGQLVIIQHEGDYLTAYGYVQDLQVEEGKRVAAGRHIANMGVGPGSLAELHFEVRHEGEPIKPQSVLPAL